MAKITLHIEADGTAELHAELNKLLAGHGSNGVQAEIYTQTGQGIVTQAERDVLLEVAEANVEASQSVIEEPKTEKKTRKPRAAKVEEAPVVVAETTEEERDMDEADEAAEEDEHEETPGTATLTRDDVRGALRDYIKKFGMEAVELDAPALFKLVFKEQNVSRISEIPETQEALAAAVAGIKEMISKNPFKRAEVK